MSKQPENSLESLATDLFTSKKKVIPIYAFNGVGKTRLSVAYKDVTKANNKGNHAGVYYNAYSEDLFYWDNDEENSGQNISLLVEKSTLNQYHSFLDEDIIREKLAPYNPTFEFEFSFYDDVEEGIEFISFYDKNQESSLSNDDAQIAAAAEEEDDDDDETRIPIKISRGEERIFVWCFFLALFEIEGWTGDGKQSNHIFIDDPISSLDDHNIFVSAFSVIDLIERLSKTRKIIITTHHFGFFSIIANWLTKSEKADDYKDSRQLYILKKNTKGIKLLSPKNDVFLYHLELLQILKTAKDEDQIYRYHFALLRQVIESISSFLGVGRTSYVLEQIATKEKADEMIQVVNSMSHKSVYSYEAITMAEADEQIFKDIFEGIERKYNFVLHNANSSKGMPPVKLVNILDRKK